MNTPIAAWPKSAKFEFGDMVQRCNLPSGREPAYRFKGHICGWYLTPTGFGYAVSNWNEPGLIQIFSEQMLEATP